MADQFKPVDKKLMKWAQRLAKEPEEFSHVLYNQARSIQERDARIRDLEAEVERLKESFGPWRKLNDRGDWKCIHCGHNVNRGIYPTSFGHAAYCKFNDVRPVIQRAEAAEADVERLKQWERVALSNKKTAQNQEKLWIEYKAKWEAAEAKLAAIEGLPRYKVDIASEAIGVYDTSNTSNWISAADVRAILQSDNAEGKEER